MILLPKDRLSKYYINSPTNNIIYRVDSNPHPAWKNAPQWEGTYARSKNGHTWKSVITNDEAHKAAGLTEITKDEANYICSIHWQQNYKDAEYIGHTR